MRRCASGPSNPHKHDEGGEGGGGGIIHAVGEVLAYPGNCELINKTLAYLDTHAHKHDQYAFNVVLADLEKTKDFQYTLLDPLLFCNGAIYFSDRSPQVRPYMCPYACAYMCAYMCPYMRAYMCPYMCPYMCA
jgi:hypothetical protein